ncbi:MAG: MBL fold metallo-hydrolase [Ignisphaera sp.]|nr:MBL fold metallo-hydrolase [Ignisphaera sp.]MDW8085981.1 MBL fold metallo-hydrolase [Ignisphaera sp.]
MNSIVRIVTSMYETNSYVVYAGSTAFVVDVGEDVKKLIDVLSELRVDVEAIIITHGHADHFAGLPVLRERFPQMRVCMSRRDLRVAELTAPVIYPEAYRELLENLKIDVDLAEGVYRFGGILLRVLEVPGHSPGSIAIHLPQHNALFTGDTLFAGSVGRTDLFGGSSKSLVRSICRLYRELPPSIHVYPGHGPETTLENERRGNIYVVHALERCCSTTL